MVYQAFRINSKGKFVPSAEGDYDADHEKVTTYSKDKNTGKMVPNINSETDEKGKKVEAYKYCKGDGLYRRHVGGKYDENGNKLRHQSHLTEQIIKAGRSSSGQCSGSGSGRAASGTGTSGGGHTLSSAEIERQDRQDAMNAELFNNPSPPPSYNNRNYVDPNPPLLTNIRGDQPNPGYTSKPESYSKPTGETPNLGKRPGHRHVEGSFDGRANLAYSSEDAKNRRGNRSSSGGFTDSQGHKSSSDSQGGLFDMSDYEEEKKKKKKAQEKADTAAAKKRDEEAAAAQKKEDEKKKAIKAGKQPVASSSLHKRTISASSGSMADSENSPPKSKTLVSRPKVTSTDDRGRDSRSEKRSSNRTGSPDKSKPRESSADRRKRHARRAAEAGKN